MLTLRPRSVWETYNFFKPTTDIFDLLDQISKETGTHQPETSVNSTVIKNDNNVEIYVELPGVNKKNLSVTAEAGKVVIKAKKNVANCKTEVMKSWTAGKQYDLTTVAAELTDGVLKLTVDKLPDVRPRQIKIK